MRALIPSIVLLVAACEPAASDQRMEIPAELEQLRDNALACSRDVQFARIENSEHCTLAAEHLFDGSKSECEKVDTKACKSFARAQDDIYLIYQGAIAESLFEHGKGDAVELLSKKTWWRGIYFDGNIMRRLYEECLKREATSLARDGLVPAHEIFTIPLKDGQQCFRSGYPEFETKPLVT